MVGEMERKLSEQVSRLEDKVCDLGEKLNQEILRNEALQKRLHVADREVNEAREEAIEAKNKAKDWCARFKKASARAERLEKRMAFSTEVKIEPPLHENEVFAKAALHALLDKRKAKQRERYEEAVSELQSLWEENGELLTEGRARKPGIRSSQVKALIMYLIQKGVL